MARLQWVLVLAALAPIQYAAAGVVFQDSFDAANGSGISAINANLAARQSGTSVTGGSITYVTNVSGNPSLNNDTAITGNQLAITSTGGATYAVSPNYNFSSSLGHTYSISVDINPNVGGTNGAGWAAITCGGSASLQGVTNTNGLAVYFTPGGAFRVWSNGTQLGGANLTVADSYHLQIDVVNGVASLTMGGALQNTTYTVPSNSANYISLVTYSTDLNQVNSFDNLVVTAPVPEVSALGIMGLGAAGLLTRRKK